MATITSNSDAVVRGLFSLSQAFNLRRRPYRSNHRLGDELADAAALAIEDRSVNKQEAPDGNPWAKLKEKTIARKRRMGQDTRINIATHTMLDVEQIRGQVTVTADTLVMSAGLDEPTQAKVGYAQEGDDSRGRPARPFYDLGKDGEKAVDDLLSQVRDNAITEAENA